LATLAIASVGSASLATIGGNLWCITGGGVGRVGSGFGLGGALARRRLWRIACRRGVLGWGRCVRLRWSRGSRCPARSWRCRHGLGSLEQNGGGRNFGCGVVLAHAGTPVRRPPHGTPVSRHSRFGISDRASLRFATATDLSAHPRESSPLCGGIHAGLAAVSSLRTSRGGHPVWLDADLGSIVSQRPQLPQPHGDRHARDLCPGAPQTSHR